MNASDITTGIEFWKRTGHGVDPNQEALRHYDGGQAAGCECLCCKPGLHPIVERYPSCTIEHYPTPELVAELAERIENRCGVAGLTK